MAMPPLVCIVETSSFEGVQGHRLLKLHCGLVTTANDEVLFIWERKKTCRSKIRTRLNY